MIPYQILNNIEQVELISRKMLSGEITGDFRTLFKGSGFEFNQLREYEQGDDIRFIDWKSSARNNKILVKQYLEDRNRIVILMVDFSNSTTFGSNETKLNMIQKIAGVLAFTGLHSKDSVGLVIFTDQIEFFLPPGNSRSHIINLVAQLFSHKAKSIKSDFSHSLKQLSKYLNKRALVCVISDFMFSIDNKFLSTLNNIHDLILFRCIDELEEKFPKAGLLNIKDLETGQIKYLNTDNLSNISVNFFYKQNLLFQNLGIDFINMYTNKPLISELAKFFYQRSIPRG